jgi:hypothetical protein
LEGYDDWSERTEDWERDLKVLFAIGRLIIDRFFGSRLEYYSNRMAYDVGRKCARTNANRTNFSTDRIANLRYVQPILGHFWRTDKVIFN